MTACTGIVDKPSMPLQKTLVRLFSGVAAATALFFTSCRESQSAVPLQQSFAAVAAAKPVDTLYDPQSPPIERHYRWYQRHDDMMKIDSNRKAFQVWAKRLDPLRGLPLAEQAVAVDRIVDAHMTWVSDSVTYGASEYAAAPLMSIRRGTGDCDDYAILKYYALEYLGVPEDRRYMMGVAIKGKGTGMDHAVTAIDLSPRKDLSQVVILDNRDEETHPRGRAFGLGETVYAPVFVVNKKRFQWVF